jgi:hypothetical protein
MLVSVLNKCWSRDAERFTERATSFNRKGRDTSFDIYSITACTLLSTTTDKTTPKKYEAGLRVCKEAQAREIQPFLNAKKIFPTKQKVNSSLREL